LNPLQLQLAPKQLEQLVEELKPVEMEFEKAFATVVSVEFPSKVVLMVILHHPFPI
jgi:hypothetical protein